MSLDDELRKLEHLAPESTEETRAKAASALFNDRQSKRLAKIFDNACYGRAPHRLTLFVSQEQITSPRLAHQWLELVRLTLDKEHGQAWADVSFRLTTEHDKEPGLVLVLVDFFAPEVK